MNAAPAQQVAAWASLAEEQQLEALQKAASGRLAQMLLASSRRRRKGARGAAADAVVAAAAMKTRAGLLESLGSGRCLGR